MKLKAIQKFTRREGGWMTVFGLFITLACLAIGGLAIDVTNVMMARTQMQVASDTTAHAALYYRDLGTAGDAKIAALAVAETNMPNSKYGSLLSAADIRFGVWDSATRTFTADSNSKTAVRVDVSQLEAKGNSIGTYFLKFAAFTSWDVRRASVFETYIPTCFREGFVADNLIDLQSNNVFKEGFCLHSNEHVEMNNDNVFENNTIVSMPTKTDVVTPSGDYSANPGLEPALHDGAYQIRVLNDLPMIIDDLYLGVGSDDYPLPSYVTDPTVHTVVQKNVTMGQFTSGGIHQVNCNGSQKLRFLANNTFSDIIVVTNCRVEFGALVELHNVTVATTNTNIASMASAAQFQIGVNDHCADGGGSRLLSLGGMSFPALLEVFGSQLIALKDIEFTANANGIDGVSFISGGTISGTSNMTMGFCGGTGMDNLFVVEYFRLAL